MSARRFLALALLLALTSGCTQWTTKFRSGAIAQDERHERRTIADAFGGSNAFDLSKQCDRGEWAELTIETRPVNGLTESWRCRRGPAERAAEPVTEP